MDNNFNNQPSYGETNTFGGNANNGMYIQPTPRKTGKILIIIAIILMLLCCCCGGGTLLTFFIIGSDDNEYEYEYDIIDDLPTHDIIDSIPTHIVDNSNSTINDMEDFVNYFKYNDKYTLYTDDITSNYNSVTSNEINMHLSMYTSEYVDKYNFFDKIIVISASNIMDYEVADIENEMKDMGNGWSGYISTGAYIRNFRYDSNSEICELITTDGEYHALYRNGNMLIIADDYTGEYEYEVVELLNKLNIPI